MSQIQVILNFIFLEITGLLLLLLLLLILQHIVNMIYVFKTSNDDNILISGTSTNPEINIGTCRMNLSKAFAFSTCGGVSHCYEACWTTTIDENTYTLSNTLNGNTYTLCVNTNTGSSTLLQQGESEQGVICNLQITKQ